MGFDTFQGGKTSEREAATELAQHLSRDLEKDGVNVSLIAEDVALIQALVLDSRCSAVPCDWIDHWYSWYRSRDLPLCIRTKKHIGMLGVSDLRPWLPEPM